MPRCLFAAAVLALATAGHAVAGSFSASPLRVDLGARAPMATLTVRNTGQTPISLQVDTVTWRQEASGDVLEPSRELIVNPPIFSLGAGESQIIRVALRAAPARDRERMYRLFVAELPPPAEERKAIIGSIVLLRMSIPVVVAPLSGEARPLGAWRARQAPPDKVRITVANEGSGHLKLTDLEMRAVGDKRVLRKAPLTYVLPGASHTWEVPWPSAAVPRALRVVATTNAGPLDTQIPVETP